MSKVQNLREQVFSFIYVLTERSDQPGIERRFPTIIWSLLYLIDAGQVISAMFLSAHGWHPDVLLFIDKLDVFKTIFKSVSQYFKHFFVPDIT